jgi:hypothetical protein
VVAPICWGPVAGVLTSLVVTGFSADRSAMGAPAPPPVAATALVVGMGDEPVPGLLPSLAPALAPVIGAAFVADWVGFGWLADALALALPVVVALADAFVVATALAVFLWAGRYRTRPTIARAATTSRQISHTSTDLRTRTTFGSLRPIIMPAPSFAMGRHRFPGLAAGRRPAFPRHDLTVNLGQLAGRGLGGLFLATSHQRNSPRSRRFRMSPEI